MAYNFPDSPGPGTIFAPSGGPVWQYTDGAWVQIGIQVVVPWLMTVAATMENLAITTGDAKLTFYMDANVTLTEVFTGVSTQSSSGPVTIDIRREGATIFSTPPSIEANENTSLTGVHAVLSASTFTKGQKMQIDVDAAGTGAIGLKVTLIGLIV